MASIVFTQSGVFLVTVEAARSFLPDAEVGDHGYSTGIGFHRETGRYRVVEQSEIDAALEAEDGE